MTNTSEVAAPKTVPATNLNMDPEQECLKIRQAIWTLSEIDNWHTWKVDFLATLIFADDPSGSPLGDRRLDAFLNVFDLYFRQFEVRSDLSFRHGPDLFDAAGFRTDGDLHYSDSWFWDVSPNKLSMARKFFKKTRILEVRIIPAVKDEFPCIDTQLERLRADLIIQTLKSYDPDNKYVDLKY